MITFTKEEYETDEWILRNGEKVNRVIRVNNIPAFYQWEGDDTHAYIDKSIAKIIELLNQHGYVTWVSCSGLHEDHGPNEGSSMPYLGFRNTDDKLILILAECDMNFCTPGDLQTFYMPERDQNIRRKNLEKLEEMLKNL